MLGKAEAGAWDDLISLESRRGTMITQYFAAIQVGGADAGDAACISELRTLNDRILEIGKDQRQRLMKLLAESHLQRHAATRYRQTRAG
jgi:hypothetical protein